MDKNKYLDLSGLTHYTEKVVNLINSGLQMRDITYSELKTLRNNSQLIPGANYRITDYTCTTTQTNTQSAGNVFDIIVVADSESKLNENARAIQHSGDTYFDGCKLESWELKYCLDNDSDRFSWASSGGTGVIYYMKDEWNNECPYDFKNIQFKRWNITTYQKNPSLIYNNEDNYYRYSYGAMQFDGTTQSISGATYGSVYEFFYTFALKDLASENWYDYTVINKMSLKAEEDIPIICYGNKIKRASDEYNSGNGKIAAMLNDIVFFNCYTDLSDTSHASDYSYCNSNVFVEDCYLNTFGNDCHGNTFENNCLNNTFGNSCESNKLLCNCYENTFGNSCFNMLLNIACNNNTFSKNSHNNILGNSCYSNIFGENCDNNKFGNSCYNNQIGENCDNNKFGKSCYSNILGNSCYNNQLGENCYNNKFGNSCHNNVFDNSCYNNQLGENCYNNKFGNSCHNNTFETNCYENNFGDLCVSNKIGNYCYRNTFDNYSGLNWLGVGCTLNKIGINSVDNILSGSCHNNEIGNNSFNITLCNRCYSNKFGKNCEHITFNKADKITFENITIDGGVKYIALSCRVETYDDAECKNIHIKRGVIGTSEQSPKSIDIGVVNNNYQITISTPNDIVITV